MKERVCPDIHIICPEGHTRASFSQERMTYLDQEGRVVYMSKDGKDKKVFLALEWLAVMCFHLKILFTLPLTPSP